MAALKIATSSPTAARPAPELDRLSILLWGLLLLMWVYQVRYPPMSYPTGGAYLLAASIMLAMLLAVIAYQQRPTFVLPHLNPACLAGLAFLSYVSLRWAAQRFASVGAANYTTLAGCGLWAFCAYYIISLAKTKDSPNTTHRSVIILLVAVAGVGFCSGIHAVVQYVWLYDLNYQALLQELGTAEPTPLQVGLLHHFRIKRVASVWGDPNALAAMCAMSTAAALELLRQVRTKRTEGFGVRSRSILTFLCVAAILSAISGIVLTDSRGGLLDLALVIAIYALGWLYRYRVVAATVCCIAVLTTALFARSTTDTNTSSTSWAWRSNTIRERIFYTAVGFKMMQLRPVTGLGLGSVDLYFGRLKPPEARESKYLHNWLLQLGAETGLIGIALAGGFICLLYVNLVARNTPVFGVVVMASVFILDALFQLSFNQRELMALFGICCGVLLATGRHGAIPISTLRIIAPVAGLVAFLPLAFAGVPHLLAQGKVEQAHSSMETGQLAAAKELLEQARRLDPRDHRTLQDLAMVSEGRGEISDALQLADAAIHVQPESASARAMKAHLLQRAGRRNEVVEAVLREALERYPASAEYNYQMALLLHRAGRHAEALTYARKAAEFGAGLPGSEKYMENLQLLDRPASAPEGT